MAFSSSSPFISPTVDSPLLSCSHSDNFEKIVDGVPTGLGRRTGLFPPVGDGDVKDLKLTGGLTISIFGLMYCLLSWSFVVDLFTPASFGGAAGAGGVLLLSDGPVNR